MPMHPAVAASIVALYDAFDGRRLSALEGCPCCTTPEELEALVRIPRRELTRAQLRNFATSAMSTIGNVDDFRYFWPRVAELLVTTQPDEHFVDPEILLGKLPDAEWRTWRNAEQRATEQYLVSLITRMSDEALYWLEVDRWVCGVGLALEDITSVLDRALLADTPAARANLFGLYHRNKRDIEKRRSLGNSSWDL